MMDNAAPGTGIAGARGPADRAGTLSTLRLYRTASPSISVMRAALASAVCVLCITPPADAARLAEAFRDCTSIVVAAVPYVAAGALAASLVRRALARVRSHGHFVIIALALFNPGCDCALNSYVSAFDGASAPLAGFVLTFAAIASPISLAVTWSALGFRLACARLAGAVLAAALTAIAWRFMPDRRATHGSGCSEVASATSTLASAFEGIIAAAACAAAAKQFVPVGFWSHVSPAGIAAIAAVLSPCSTADPFMAAALIRDAR
ncbi:MAG: hypothetical protein JO219_00595, partial [Candidatus Eremiobacteraeota bacterium]|nr:hypothetical protein [Candidatus Eremiobacteraeota bacterium]